MDRPTVNSDFIGPSVRQESKKSYLEQKSGTLFEREKNNRKLNPFMKTMVIGKIYTIVK